MRLKGLFVRAMNLWQSGKSKAAGKVRPREIKAETRKKVVENEEQKDFCSFFLLTNCT